MLLLAMKRCVVEGTSPSAAAHSLQPSLAHGSGEAGRSQLSMSPPPPLSATFTHSFSSKMIWFAWHHRYTSAPFQMALRAT